MLTEEELLQYNRQILYMDFGKKGQSKLKRSHIVIVGLGGLGCTALMQLACSGIGHISIIDSDTVDISDLNRQVLHWHDDIGKKKVTSAADKIARLNPSIKVTPVCTRIIEDNVRNVIKQADAVLDAVDNYDTRYILNKACVAEEIPFIHGTVHGLYGQVTTIIPGKTPCFNCFYPTKREEISPLPIFGTIAACIATIQCIEVIKLIAGFGQMLAGRMLYIDQSKMGFFIRNLEINDNCAICGTIKQEK